MNTIFYTLALVLSLIATNVTPILSMENTGPRESLPGFVPFLISQEMEDTVKKYKEMAPKLHERTKDELRGIIMDLCNDHANLEAQVFNKYMYYVRENKLLDIDTVIGYEPLYTIYQRKRDLGLRDSTIEFILMNYKEKELREFFEDYNLPELRALVYRIFTQLLRSHLELAVINSKQKSGFAHFDSEKSLYALSDGQIKEWGTKYFFILDYYCDVVYGKSLLQPVTNFPYGKNIDANVLDFTIVIKNNRLALYCAHQNPKFERTWYQLQLASILSCLSSPLIPKFDIPPFYLADSGTTRKSKKLSKNPRSNKSTVSLVSAPLTEGQSQQITEKLERYRVEANIISDLLITIADIEYKARNQSEEKKNDEVRSSNKEREELERQVENSTKLKELYLQRIRALIDELKRAKNIPEELKSKLDAQQTKIDNQRHQLTKNEETIKRLQGELANAHDELQQSSAKLREANLGNQRLASEVKELQEVTASSSKLGTSHPGAVKRHSTFQKRLQRVVRQQRSSRETPGVKGDKHRSEFNRRDPKSHAMVRASDKQKNSSANDNNAPLTRVAATQNRKPTTDPRFWYHGELKKVKKQKAKLGKEIQSLNNSLAIITNTNQELSVQSYVSKVQLEGYKEVLRENVVRSAVLNELCKELLDKLRQKNDYIAQLETIIESPDEPQQEDPFALGEKENSDESEGETFYPHQDYSSDTE
jgi:hypothetical protein